MHRSGGEKNAQKRRCGSRLLPNESRCGQLDRRRRSNYNKRTPEMNKTLTLVVYMGIVTWVTLLVASLIRAKGWTPAGMKLALGNRANLPEATPLAGRAQRTAANTLENFVFFAAIALVAEVAGSTNPRIESGAEIFFWARIAFIPIYYAGIIYLRTATWVTGIIGLGMMVSALL
jgi:uncharacterized MAPEG superfamily protein